MQNQANKPNLEWIITTCEASTERYIENEKFMLMYISLPLWKRALFGRKIMLDHLLSMMKRFDKSWGTASDVQTA